MEAAMAHIYNSRTQEAMAEGLHGKACLGYIMSSRPTGADRPYQRGVTEAEMFLTCTKH